MILFSSISRFFCSFLVKDISLIQPVSYSWLELTTTSLLINLLIYLPTVVVNELLSSPGRFGVVPSSVLNVFYKLYLLSFIIICLLFLYFEIGVDAGSTSLSPNSFRPFFLLLKKFIFNIIII